MTFPWQWKALTECILIIRRLVSVLSVLWLQSVSRRWLSIKSWSSYFFTALYSRKSGKGDEPNFFQAHHPVICPLCLKIFCATYTLMNSLHYNVCFRLRKKCMGLWGGFPMSKILFFIAHCSALFENVNFFEQLRFCFYRL
jgi:hypothetical protein